MPRFFLMMTAALLAAAPAAAARSIDAAGYEALRGIDLRMATIAYRLVTANAPLCREHQPVPGLVLHAIDQYEPSSRPLVRTIFGFPTPVAIEGVVADGPAARAGLAANDGVTAIGDDAMPGPTNGDATSITRDAAQTIVARQPSDKPVVWHIDRAGAARTVTLNAPQGCRSAFEVLLGPGMTASSDGKVVQIGVRFFERYTDDEVAVVVAHELAHTILQHRIRLDAAGVKWGLLAEFGRNGRLFRRTEEEADLLGVALLRNAGYDPQGAVRFWRDHGGDVDGGLMRSRTHPSSKARAAAIEVEIAKMPTDRATLYRPALLATWDEPLS